MFHLIMEVLGLRVVIALVTGLELGVPEGCELKNF
jgi:hypothetical protein